ncbi:MAG: EMC6-like membrane protein [Candidatus Alkanophagales archaeon]
MGAGAGAGGRRLEEFRKAVVPSVFGVLAGVFSFLAGDAGAGVLVLVLAVLAQKGVFTATGTEMSGRDWASVVLTTLLWWFIAWTLLLSVG